MACQDSGPDTLAARLGLADLIAEAHGGLSDGDRAVLELAYRHGLDGVDLAEALEVSLAQARTMAVRVRRLIEWSLGALLVARGVRANPARCPELATILGDWDGDITALMRKRFIRHIESCPTCEAERRRLVTPEALLGSPPVFIPAPDWLRARTLRCIGLIPASPSGETPVRPALRAITTERRVVAPRRRRTMVALAGLIALVTATVITARWLVFGDCTPTSGKLRGKKRHESPALRLLPITATHWGPRHHSRSTS